MMHGLMRAGGRVGGRGPMRSVVPACVLALLTASAAAAGASASAPTAGAAPVVRWLVIGASDATPVGIARRAKALSASGAGEGLVLSTADCGEPRPVFAWAAEVARDPESARSALARLKPQVADAYVKRCAVRAGSLLALDLPAVDPSIAEVPDDAVNWTDRDRVSERRTLGPALGLVLQRYRTAVPDDPLEGRRTRLLLVRPGAAPALLLDDCAGLAAAVAGHGWLALACDSEQAADHVLHTVHAFSDTGEPAAAVPRCRQPRLPGGNKLVCQGESVDASGRLRLVPRSISLQRR